MKRNLALIAAALTLYSCRPTPENRQYNDTLYKTSAAIELLENQVDSLVRHVPPALMYDQTVTASKSLQEAQTVIDLRKNQCNTPYSNLNTFCTDRIAGVQDRINVLKQDIRMVPKKEREERFAKIDELKAYLLEQSQQPFSQDSVEDQYAARVTQINAYVKDKIGEICSDNKGFRSLCLDRIADAHLGSLRTIERVSKTNNPHSSNIGRTISATTHEYAMMQK
jgi:hypothetical protein